MCCTLACLAQRAEAARQAWWHSCCWAACYKLAVPAESCSHPHCALEGGMCIREEGGSSLPYVVKVPFLTFRYMSHVAGEEIALQDGHHMLQVRMPHCRTIVRVCCTQMPCGGAGALPSSAGPRGAAAGPPPPRLCIRQPAQPGITGSPGVPRKAVHGECARSCRVITCGGAHLVVRTLPPGCKPTLPLSCTACGPQGRLHGHCAAWYVAPLCGPALR